MPGSPHNRLGFDLKFTTTLSVKSDKLPWQITPSHFQTATFSTAHNPSGPHPGDYGVKFFAWPGLDARATGKISRRRPCIFIFSLAKDSL